jgi:hypothetical protein
MLRGATAAILTLLVSSLGAYCEGARVLMPAVDSCTVEDDNQWTAQERFVWRHVCAGEVADFNEGSIYGGNLDPERSAAWPANRVLTPAFLQAILLEDKYRRLVTRHGVRIVGARFTEAIELANAELKHELWLDKSLIEKGGTLSRLRSTEPISFEGSNIGDWLDMTDIRVEAGLSMRESRFTEISLIRARVGKFLEMRRSVIGRIEMSDLQVDGNLWMDEAKFDGLVGLDAKVRGDVSLTGARAAGPVFMDRLQVGGSLLMDEAEFGGVRLVNARVGGYLDVSRSKVADDFMA